MATLHLRDIPDELREQARRKAAAHGQTLSAYVASVLQSTLADRAGSDSAGPDVAAMHDRGKQSCGFQRIIGKRGIPAVGGEKVGQLTPPRALAQLRERRRSLAPGAPDSVLVLRELRSRYG